MKTVRVVAAIICDSMEKKSRIFSTARGYGEFEGKWEFPGGKIEEGETPQEALKREIREELDTEIEVGDLIDTIEYDYPTFHLSMQCFWAEVVSGHLELKEAEAARWLTADTIDSVEWLPADRAILGTIKEAIQCREKDH
ncbi:MAG: (deoxy)nucleoside triphosphate pyrophosphohydrolase [Lachnospiraceae bacterium]|nr:(deoxy)nucleoside triphosphate pyrophosphohydrolase [Lachnospiraceae bacterium]